MTDVQNKALYIAEQCRKAGMTLAGAAGVLKNIEAEGVWDSGNLEDRFNQKLGVSDAQYVREVDAGTRNFIDGTGFGLIQWTFWSRKRDLLQFARQRGVSIADFKMQVDFLIEEMRRDFPKVWELCCSSNDPVKCCHDVCRYYENPKDAANEAKRRANDVGKWYDFLVSAMQEGKESTIQEQNQEPKQEATDDEGIPIPRTWPPRTIDRTHCDGWPEIKLMQSLLALQGYGILIDGIFGTSTEAQLRAFQSSVGIAADGVCGPDSYIALGISKTVFGR